MITGTVLPYTDLYKGGENPRHYKREKDDDDSLVLISAFTREERDGNGS